MESDSRASSAWADHHLPSDLPIAALLDAAPDAIVIVDSDGKIVAVNAQAERWFGYSRDELFDQPVEMLLPDRFHARHVAHRTGYAAAPDTRLVDNGLELIGRRGDGTEFPIEVSLSPLQTPQGLLVTSIIRDISERTQLDAALQESERRFRALFDQAFQFIGLLTPDGIVLEANETALSFVGLTLSDIQGRYLWETEWWTSPEDQERLRAAVDEAARGEVVRFEAIHRGVDGATITVDFSLKPVVDANGSVTLLMAEGRDITARKVAERERQELLAREHEARTDAERLQLVSDTALSHLSLDELLPEILNRLVNVLRVETCTIFLLDADARLLRPYASAGLELEAIAPIDIPVGRYFSGRVAESRQVMMMEDVQAEDLGISPVDMHSIHSVLGAPLLVSDRLIGVIRVGAIESRGFSDADANLIRLAADRVALAIDHALLYRQTQEAVRARETFLSIASHELKTPLTTVKGWVHLLASALRDPKGFDQAAIAEFADELEGQVDRLDGLINDLLDVSRIQQGRLELRPEPVDLVHLLQTVLRRFDYAPERTPQHALNLEAPDAAVGYWDPDRLEQVMTNLLSNAFKYSPEGGTITVRLERTELGIALSVADQGIGIEPDDHAQLFEPFTRSEAARSSASGTGLGLYITKQIVEQHGGSIEVKSDAGIGTTVIVLLPVSQPDAAISGSGGFRTR